MGGVHSLLVFGVEAVVHIVADVDKAPLVDAAVGFAQAVDPVALRQGQAKQKPDSLVLTVPTGVRLCLQGIGATTDSVSKGTP